MKNMDLMARLQRQRRKLTHAKLGPVFLIFILLSSLRPIPLCAQTTDPPKTGAPQTATPKTDTMKVETYVERAERKGTVLRLSLKDAMRMALQNNLTIAIQDYSEEIYRSRIFGAAHVYEPHLVTGIGWRSNTNPNISFFNRTITSDVTTQRNLNWSARLLQSLPYGGSYYVDYGTQRFVQLPPTVNDLFASRYAGNLTFSFNQPLVRDFRNNQNFRALKLAKLDERINDTQFEEQVTAVIKQVQDVYWELVYAIQNQNILKKSLDLARVQVDNNRRKVEIGILAPISVTEALAEEARRVQDMIAAENQINNMENNLKRTLSRDRTSELWNQDIVPTEGPEFMPIQLNMDEAIVTALQKRPELRRTQLKTEQIDVDYKFYQNQKKPKVDFNGIFGTIGTAGTPTPLGLSITPTGAPLVPSNLVGSLGAVNRQLFSAPYRSYVVGIQLDIPLRNRPLQETLAQLALQRRQNMKQLKDSEQMVIVEVRNALQSIQTNQQVVETAKVGYKLANEQYEAENKRFQAGLSTTFFVLERQRNLAEAEGRLLRAQVDYRKSLNDLQKAKFTTIDQNDMEVAKSQVPANER